MPKKIYTISKSHYLVREYDVLSEGNATYVCSQQLTGTHIRISKYMCFDNLNDAQQAILDYHLEHVTELGNKIKEARKKLETFKQQHDL